MEYPSVALSLMVLSLTCKEALDELLGILEKQNGHPPLTDFL
ncbi:hypothetical protein [Proteiniphilum sp.]